MKSRARFTGLLVFLMFALFQLAACSGTPSTFNKVTISPSGTQFIGQSGSIALSATVLNDTAGNGGVTFSASPAGTGTLTQLSTTTGTYVAPGAVTTETVVTITATSVDFPNQSATLTVKIEPPPVITTTSLPTATLNAAYTAPVTATGGVPPLSWTIASGTLPAGLSLGSSKTDTVNITGKATTAGQSIVTIMVTDAVGETSTSGPLTIVVSSLALTTTSPLPSATVNVPYVGVQFAATGGNSPYTFTLASGAVLPPGLTFTNGDLAGTPTAEGTYTFGVTVTDSTTPTPAVITQNFTLSVTPPQNLSLLSGNYAFTFSGNNSGGYVAAAGVFTANGNGTITAGEADYNALNGSPVNYPNLQGTYTVGQDGRGAITFTNVTGSPIYAFSIDASGTGNTPGSHGRLVEFDSTGTRGSGRLEMQSVTSCVVNSTNSTYNGNYAFGGTGFQSSAGGNSAGTMAFAGVFTAVPPVSPATVGSLGPAEIDANYNGSPAVGSTAGTALSGSYQSGPDSTHCQFQFSAFATLNYDVYPISATDAFFIETDQASNATTPFISVAEMKLQSGQPFFGSVISGPMAGGVSGQVLSVPYVSVLQIVPQSGITTFSLSLTDNEAGTVTSTNGNPFSVTYTTDQYGRVFANGFEVNNAFEPVLYMIDSQDAFAVGQLNGAPMFGEFDAQSQPTSFTTTFISQNFPLIEGTVAPAVSSDRDFSGFLNFNGSVTPATINGIQDESTASANTAAEAVTGTYVLSSTGATDGSGTVTLTSPAAFTGAFYFVSPTKMVEITTTTGDASPILIIIGD